MKGKAEDQRRDEVEGKAGRRGRCADPRVGETGFKESGHQSALCAVVRCCKVTRVGERGALRAGWENGSEIQAHP